MLVYVLEMMSESLFGENLEGLAIAKRHKSIQVPRIDRVDNVENELIADIIPFHRPTVFLIWPKAITPTTRPWRY